MWPANRTECPGIRFRSIPSVADLRDVGSCNTWVRRRSFINAIIVTRHIGACGPLWELAGRNVIDEDAIRELRAIDLADAEREAEMCKEIHAERDAAKLL